MTKKIISLLTSAVLMAVFFTGCASTKQEVQNGFTPDQKLFLGTWTETNRDGNAETIIFNADGSFEDKIVTPDGALVEADLGKFTFEKDLLKISINQVKGDWSNWEFEKIEPPVELVYGYSISQDKLHLERFSKTMFGNTELFSAPYPEDNYTRK